MASSDASKPPATGRLSRLLQLRPMRILRGASWIVALRGVRQLTMLVTYYVMVRALEVDIFGAYGVFVALIALFAMTTFPGLNNATTQCAARGEMGMYREAVRWSLLGSLGGSVFCLGAAGYFHAFGGQPALALAFVGAAILFPLSHGMLQWRNVLMGQEKFASFFVFGAATAILNMGLIVIGVSVFPDELLVPAMVVLAGPAIFNVAMTLATTRRIERSGDHREAIRYGLRTSGYLALNNVANQLDKILIFTIFTPELAAIYVVAERASELVKAVVQDLGATLVPRFARMVSYSGNLDRKLKLAAAGISCLVLLVAFTVLPPAMLLLFSEKYADSIVIAQGLMVSVAIGNFATLRYRYMTSKLDSASVRDVTIVMSVVRIVSSLILVPMFGLWGAVAAAVVYRLSSAAVTSYALRKRHFRKEETQAEPS
ncbi:MAG: oligosaccharide flippase family protein [Alphaproteobacteria bacterium]